jgi:MerR family mercuric resistance operon transcriptional regulator/MerR family gold-responsive transcriptional activator of gol and ges genes
MASGVTIGRLAKAVGVNVQTIRYYERRRLLSPPVRTPSWYRVYGDEEIRRLRFIRNAQALGFTLQEITDLLNLRVSVASRCGDVQRRAQAKLVQVKAKVRTLEALARALKGLLRACRAGQPTDRCPILKGLEEERRSNHGNRQAKS